MATAPILDLETLVEPRHVRIDRQNYVLRGVDELPIAVIKRLQIDGPRLGTLMEADQLADGEEAEMARLLGALVDVVLDAPAEVRARLSDVHRMQIAQAFTQLRSSQRLATGAAPEAKSQTGSRSPRGSSGSMAARTRRRG